VELATLATWIDVCGQVMQEPGVELSADKLRI
jgi:hypothetical protein